MVDIDQFLRVLLVKNNKTKYVNDSYKHFKKILELIQFKMFNPDIPECSFVTHCCNEDWDKALYAADTYNREAIESLDMFKSFNTFVKNTHEFKAINRDNILNKIL